MCSLIPNDIHNFCIAVGTMALAAIFLTMWNRNQRSKYVPARDVRKGHRWFYPDSMATSVYCNICELIVSNACQCDCCGVIADYRCMKVADKQLPCKPLTSVGPVTEHHLVKGNIPLGSLCSVCEQECGTDEGLSDWRCCYCHRTAHENCRSRLIDNSAACDLGAYSHFMVPPNCVRLKTMGFKGRRRLVVGEVRPPAIADPASPEWSPLVVVANRKSGNNDGQKILHAFRAFLNPVQVIDLHDLPLEGALQWCRLVADTRCRILVGGGDGTVGWVLDSIDQLNIAKSPYVAILPLGTGNDLSRVLGWGEGTSGDIDVQDILERLSTASVVCLDRWKLKITPAAHVGIRMPAKTISVNNYASVGVDALVTLKFHQTRESKAYLFGSRFLNKLLFMSFATKDVWERECKNLRDKVTLFLDGVQKELPDIEAIVLLNIPSWGAGVRPWTLGSCAHLAPVQRMDDGLLEVFAVYSTFHIAQMQVGLSEPVRLGQAKEVKMVLTEKMPMQVDGEPWEQGPGTIEVSFHSQAQMMSCEPS